MWSVRSLFFRYFEKCETEKYVDMDCAFYICLQRKIEITRRVTFEIHANAQVDLFVKCVLFLSEFNQNWDPSTNFTEAPTFKNIRSAVLHFLHADGKTDIAKLMGSIE